MSRRILRPAGFASADVDAFLAEDLAHPTLDTTRDVVIARAPGRLDLMGGIADYSGSLVLQWPLREATIAAAQIAQDGRFMATSLGKDAAAPRSCSFELAELFPKGSPLSYADARRWFEKRPSESWAAYVLGSLVVLAHEKGLKIPSGMRVLIRSSVPEGKGVSSSAALEVAVMQAVTVALGLSLPPRELALLSQTVENRVVGAACGVMDQMTAACGVAGQLLALLCQPAELRPSVGLPEDLEVWGLDSGVRHAVSGSEYTSVRVGAFMGARILADRAGQRSVPSGVPGRVLIEDTRWRGYLANVTPNELESVPGQLPDTMRGDEFLARYDGIVDSVTTVDSQQEYRVRACAEHPVREHARVRTFADLLQGPRSEERAVALGKLMYESHQSYSDCGLGSNATDALVTLVREAGPSRGFYGAKITGGGSGGTVAVLGRRGARIDEIVDASLKRHGHRPLVFSGSSPGAVAFGSVRLGPE